MTRLIKKFRRVKLKFDKRTRADFHIYQMGKVASTSIESSLKKKYNTEHLHFMFSYLLQEQFEMKILKHDTRFIEKYAGLTSFMLRNRKKKVKVITLVRDPMARNISMFFQDLHNLLYDEFKLGSRDDHDYDNFYQELFNDKVKHMFFDTWFDNELKRAFKIDVFEHPFDKEKGYGIIREKNVEILVMKMENLNELEEVIREFTDYPEFEIRRINVSSRKWYSELSDKFKKEFRADPELIEKIYSSKTVKHFYSDDEINKFKNKWSHRG